MKRRYAAAFMPIDWTRTEASRLSGVGHANTSCAIGYATTPPPSGVEPATKDPNIMAIDIGQYAEKISVSRPFRVTVNSQRGQTTRAGAQVVA